MESMEFGRLRTTGLEGVIKGRNVIKLWSQKLKLKMLSFINFSQSDFLLESHFNFITL